MAEADLFSKIILIVDDEPQVLGVMRAQLEAAGYSVIVEKTGHGALDIIEHTKLLAILLDLGLDDMNGMDVLAKIKESKPNLPVIIVTGHHEESEARKALELGAYDYVTKPIDFDYLKNVLAIQSPE